MILVTGASGTVGGEVVKALVARGAKLRAGYRSRPENVPAGVESVALDYDKPETIGPALAGVDTVFLLSNTVTPELKVVKAAKAAGVKRIVKLSVMDAPGEAYTFARWHRPVEKAIEATGLSWTFLRPNGFMQNVVNYMGETIRKQSAIYSSIGDGRVSYVDARDVGAVAARVLTEPGHEKKGYDLTGPQALSLGLVADMLSSVLDRTIRYVPISHGDYKKGLLSAGIPDAYADALVDLDRRYSGGGAAVVTPHVKKITGHDPIPFDPFARDHAEALA